jgi:hypothetical protein
MSDNQNVVNETALEMLSIPDLTMEQLQALVVNCVSEIHHRVIVRESEPEKGGDLFLARLDELREQALRHADMFTIGENHRFHRDVALYLFCYLERLKK